MARHIWTAWLTEEEERKVTEEQLFRMRERLMETWETIRQEELERG